MKGCLIWAYCDRVLGWLHYSSSYIFYCHLCIRPSNKANKNESHWSKQNRYIEWVKIILFMLTHPFLLFYFSPLSLFSSKISPRLRWNSYMGERLQKTSTDPRCYYKPICEMVMFSTSTIYWFMTVSFILLIFCYIV